MPPILRDSDYRSLANFRHTLRQFLAFSESQARRVGLEPAQHQLLLALRGLPEHERPTLTTLAARLVLKHHTVVELTDRLEREGHVRRTRDPNDGRVVLVTITPRGMTILDRLSIEHRAEIARSGPALVAALQKIVGTP